ncbi:MAG: GNAT family N-acetyltransferase, partial [Lachnospiraceae bacterium]|nr:GNAT family N-acetyltransferase [Lachnospiraceae bacterium]
MRKSSFCLKTDTLTITPSNTEDLWESDWIIAFRKGEKEQLGTATFAGVKRLGTVLLYVELLPEYRNRGLGTEIIRMLVNWAFLHKNIFEVVSQAEHENDKGVNALQKAGQAAVLLATAPKSNSITEGIGKARADVRAGRTGDVPRQLQNVHA